MTGVKKFDRIVDKKGGKKFARQRQKKKKKKKMPPRGVQRGNSSAPYPAGRAKTEGQTAHTAQLQQCKARGIREKA
mgnify:CR=1 FL=1